MSSRNMSSYKTAFFSSASAMYRWAASACAHHYYDTSSFVNQQKPGELRTGARRAAVYV
jgi:hypothetical protein